MSARRKQAITREQERGASKWRRKNDLRPVRGGLGCKGAVYRQYKDHLLTSSTTESDDRSMTHWRETIERMYAARTNAASTQSRPAFSPSASIVDVEAAEGCLAARLPESLRSLLLESDGIMDQLSVDGGPYFDNMWLLWPVGQIIDENIRFRKRVSEGSLSRTVRDVVFIASAGVDGILFGIRASDKPRDDCPIVSWYPIGHRICELTDTLADFFDGWLCNRIAV